MAILGVVYIILSICAIWLAMPMKTPKLIVQLKQAGLPNTGTATNSCQAQPTEPRTYFKDRRRLEPYPTPIKAKLDILANQLP